MLWLGIVWQKGVALIKKGSTFTALTIGSNSLQIPSHGNFLSLLCLRIVFLLGEPSLLEKVQKQSPLACMVHKLRSRLYYWLRNEDVRLQCTSTENYIDKTEKWYFKFWCDCIFKTLIRPVLLYGSDLLRTRRGTMKICERNVLHATFKVKLQTQTQFQVVKDIILDLIEPSTNVTQKSLKIGKLWEINRILFFGRFLKYFLKLVSGFLDVETSKFLRYKV